MTYYTDKDGNNKALPRFEDSSSLSSRKGRGKVLENSNEWWRLGHPWGATKSPKTRYSGTICLRILAVVIATLAGNNTREEGREVPYSSILIAGWLWLSGCAARVYIPNQAS